MSLTTTPGSEAIRIKPRHLLGVPIHPVSIERVLVQCRDAIDLKRQLVIGVVNAAKIVKMRDDRVLRDSVLSADLVLADGMAVVWASRLLRRPLPQRVAGIDLFARLLEIANEQRYTVYFVGAEQTVIDEMLRRIRERYPNLKIVGARNGYFGDAESESLAGDIRQAMPDMLFLGMTSPKKEIFLARYGRMMDVRVCHGVGGSFDIFAGKVKRAPMLWQRLGLEWLYRVVQEPRRMWRRYLVTNTIFIGMLLRELVRRAPEIDDDETAWTGGPA